MSDFIDEQFFPPSRCFDFQRPKGAFSSPAGRSVPVAYLPQNHYLCIVMDTTFHYDVIVIGAGHAGCEAACSAARMGARTVVITMDMNKIAQMSCNPAVGGIAKGQIVREVDALGGQMGEVTDATAIQFRMLNRSKGPAMWSPRAQCDRIRFIAEWRRRLENTDNLDIWQDEVTEIITQQIGRAHV